MTFTIGDLNVLLDAMEAWENDDKGSFVGELVGALLVKKDDPGYDSYQQERSRMKAEADAEKRKRKERSILLRAKLIQLLDEARAAAALNEVSA